MTRLARGASVVLVLLAPAVGAFAAGKPGQRVEGAADRGQAAKNCEAYLHSGLEALADHRQPEAEQWLKKALAEAEKVGPESLAMARAVGGLGALYLMRKEHAEAESLLSRSVALMEAAIGPNDPGLGQPLHNLAATKVLLQKYDEAESIGRRALAIREQGPDADLEDVAESLDLLALTYALQDQVPRAEEVFQKALEVREQAQGADHLDLAKALMNMAKVRASKAVSARMQQMIKGMEDLNAELPKQPSEEGFRAAEALMRRALAIREKTLGSEHPDTIDTIEELAGCYGWHDDHAGADPLLRRLLAIREKSLASDDPQLADTLDTLATHTLDQGKYREAERLLRRVLVIREKARRTQPDDLAVREAEERCAGDLRKAVRSAEVMEDPRRRITEDDLKYLNSLSFATPWPDLFSLFNSTRVQIVDQSVGDAGLAHIRGLVNAEHLHVWANRITDLGLMHIEGLTALKELNLIGSKIHGPGLAHLQRMTDLEELNLGASFLLDDAGLAHLPLLPHLKTLNLDYTQIGDAGLTHLERLPALAELSVDETNITAERIEKLKRTRPGLKLKHSKRPEDGAPFAAPVP